MGDWTLLTPHLGNQPWAATSAAVLMGEVILFPARRGGAALRRQECCTPRPLSLLHGRILGVDPDGEGSARHSLRVTGHCLCLVCPLLGKGLFPRLQILPPSCVGFTSCLTCDFSAPGLCPGLPSRAVSTNQAHSSHTRVCKVPSLQSLHGIPASWLPPPHPQSLHTSVDTTMLQKLPYKLVAQGRPATVASALQPCCESLAAPPPPPPLLGGRGTAWLWGLDALREGVGLHHRPTSFRASLCGAC